VAGVSLVASLGACGDSIADPTAHATLNVGTEVGALNYCYALLQLEADFHARVAANPFPGMLTADAASFQSFQSQVRGQVNMLKLVIPGHRISDALLFRLGQTVNYSNRTQMLTSAQTILEAEARGLDGAVALVTTPAMVDTVTILAATAKDRANGIRAMLGLEPLSTVTALSPTEVMTVLAPYYRTTFTVSSR
jgi:hypothetical protein